MSRPPLTAEHFIRARKILEANPVPEDSIYTPEQFHDPMRKQQEEYDEIIDAAERLPEAKGV